MGKDSTDAPPPSHHNLPASRARPGPGDPVSHDGRMDQMPSLAGKVAIVPGASRGIGAAVARAFAAAGAAVVLAARDRDKPVGVSAQIEAAGGEAVVLPT